MVHHPGQMLNCHLLHSFATGPATRHTMAGQKDTIAGDCTTRLKENNIADNNILYG
jgi:hypothetical protein